MNTTYRTTSRLTLAVCAAALGAAVLTFGTGGQASTGPAAQAVPVAATKADRLCGGENWPPTKAACLQSVLAASGRFVNVRLVGEANVVVERPMTDRERLEAAFAAFGTQTGLANRM